MVSIKQLYCLPFKQSKFVPISDDLIATHAGEAYLKIRPSHCKILQVICGQAAPKKNSTLSESKALMDMKKKRDAAMEAIGQPSVEEDCPGNMGLLQDAKEEQPKKKSKLKHKEGQVVHIDVAGKSIQLLCPSFRLERADLRVLLNSDHLEPVFECLHGDISAPSASKDQAPQEVEGWHIVVWLFQSMEFSMVQVKMVEPHAKFTMCMQAHGLRVAVSFPTNLGMTVVLHLVAGASPNGYIASRSKRLPTGKMQWLQ